MALRAEGILEIHVNLNGIPYRLRVVCTPLCICSLSTYRIIQGLLTRKSEIRAGYLCWRASGELLKENPPKRTQHLWHILSNDWLVGHMTE
jgi:hypothetical protein